MSVSQWVLIAANPKSGSGPAGDLLRRLSEAIASRGFQVETTFTLEALGVRAEQLHQSKQLYCVVSAGGDGTVNAVSSHLDPSVPVLIFPLGTENLLAKHWGLNCDIAQACTTLVAGRCVQMDVGLANGRRFLVMLGCGFDGEVVRRMNAVRTGHISHWSYFKPISQTLWHYDYPVFNWTACCAGLDKSGSAPWLFVFNVPRYAGNLQLCNSADPTDGKLELCVFSKPGLRMGFKYLIAVWRGRHEKLSDFDQMPIRSLRVEAPVDAKGRPVEVPFQIDGDPGGVLPLTVEILSHKLKLIVPQLTLASDPLTVMQMAMASA